MLTDVLMPGVLLHSGNRYLKEDAKTSAGLQANAFYFGNLSWAQEYQDSCHRDSHFKSRWLAAGGDWTDKVVVDLGCGPGNVFATLGGKPNLLIGVDVAAGSLELAARLGKR